MRHSDPLFVWVRADGSQEWLTPRAMSMDGILGILKAVWLPYVTRQLEHENQWLMEHLRG